MSKPLHLIALVCFALAGPPVSADVENGRVLHEESCSECHMMADHSALYTRKARKVDSLHRLGGQVSACTQALNIAWFPDDEKDVVAYLNSTYYRFQP